MTSLVTRCAYFAVTLALVGSCATGLGCASTAAEREEALAEEREDREEEEGRRRAYEAKRAASEEEEDDEPRPAAKKAGTCGACDLANEPGAKVCRSCKTPL